MSIIIPLVQFLQRWSPDEQVDALLRRIEATNEQCGDVLTTEDTVEN